jgi:hypothetical protein
MTTNAAVKRASTLLRRNGLGHIEPSALLVARLEARRRSAWVSFGVFWVYIAIFTIWSDGQSGSASAETDVSGLAWSVLTPVVMILAGCAGLWYVYRMERRLLAARRIRTAHPAAAGAARVLGSPHFAVVLIVHGGGLVLGTAAALLASRPADRALALAFLGSVAVLAALSGLALAGVLRRPSVAEDSDSLLVDDVLRTLEARTTVLPLPILVALVAAMGGTGGSWLTWSFFAYAGLGTAFWLYAEVSTRHDAAPAEVRR